MRLTLLMTTLAASLLTGTAQGAVETNRFTGQSCQGAASTDRAAVLYNSSGAQNDSTAGAVVLYCPNQWTGSLANTNSVHAIINYFDRSSVDSLSCRFEVMNSSGTILTGPWVYSCATSGGCATSTPSFASASLQRMDLSLPAGVIGMYSFAVRCSIPRKSTTLGNWSGIAGYILSHDVVGF